MNILSVLLKLQHDAECIWKCKGPGTAETILAKQSEVRGLKLREFKTYYRAAITKTMWYWYKIKHRSTEKIKSPEIFYTYIVN